MLAGSGGGVRRAGNARRGFLNVARAHWSDKANPIDATRFGWPNRSPFRPNDNRPNTGTRVESGRSPGEGSFHCEHRLHSARQGGRRLRRGDRRRFGLPNRQCGGNGTTRRGNLERRIASIQFHCRTRRAGLPIDASPSSPAICTETPSITPNGCILIVTAVAVDFHGQSCSAAQSGLPRSEESILVARGRTEGGKRPSSKGEESRGVATADCGQSKCSLVQLEASQAVSCWNPSRCEMAASPKSFLPWPPARAVNAYPFSWRSGFPWKFAGIENPDDVNSAAMDLRSPARIPAAMNLSFSWFLRSSWLTVTCSPDPEGVATPSSIRASHVPRAKVHAAKRRRRRRAFPIRTLSGQPSAGSPIFERFRLTCSGIVVGSASGPCRSPVSGRRGLVRGDHAR